MRTLGCLWNRRLVERYLDSALSGRASRRVAGHLGACAGCRARAEAHRSLRRALLEAAPSVPEPDWTGLWRGVRARIVQESRARDPRRAYGDPWWLPLWMPVWGHPRLAAGTVAAVAVTLGLLVWPASDPDGPAWAAPVEVQDVTSADPDRPVMVFSGGREKVTVIWVFAESAQP